MNPLDAAYNLVRDYPGGASSLAPRLDKNPSVLSHEVTATGSAKLGLLTAIKITELSGDLCTEVAGDLKDSQINDNELKRIDLECGHLISTVHTLREALARRNLTGKPAHLQAAA